MIISDLSQLDNYVYCHPYHIYIYYIYHTWSHAVLESPWGNPKETKARIARIVRACMASRKLSKGRALAQCEVRVWRRAFCQPANKISLISWIWRRKIEAVCTYIYVIHTLCTCALYIYVYVCVRVYIYIHITFSVR